jgi:hypothetical protein
MSNSYSDLIEKTARNLTPQAVGQAINITSNYTAASGTLTLDASSPALAAVRPGVILANNLNVFYVFSIASNVATVVGGYQGSVDASQVAGAGLASIVYIKPRFTRWDISVEINNEIDSLSAPAAGCGQIRRTTVTYVPSFMGYALPATFDSLTSKVLEVSLDEPLPYKRNPLIRRGEFRVDRSGFFGAGISGLIVYKPGWAGLPLRIQYLAPYSHLVNPTDDALTVGGVAVTTQDILPMGAALRLAPDREIQRNSMSFQPDPRKAPEVPPGAILGSVRALEARYERRKNEESQRIGLSYPQAEGW